MRRKSLLPKIFLILFLWGSWFYLIFKFPPEKIYLLGLFFFLFFFASGFTFSLISDHKRYSFLLSATLTIFLALRFLKMTNVLNIILLLALVFTLGLFFHQKESGRKRHLPQG